MFIKKLEQAIQGEYEAYYFYQEMSKLTNDPYWKGFIEHALEDEKSHYEMFQQLHYMLTGSYVQNVKKGPTYPDLKAYAKQAVKDELDASELYKEMLLQIPIQQAYAPLFLAMHDETEHAIRFSMMYNAL